MKTIAQYLPAAEFVFQYSEKYLYVYRFLTGGGLLGKNFGRGVPLGL